MSTARFKRALSALLAVMLSVQFVLPSAALAAQRQVQMDEHAASPAEATPVSGIKIGGVDAPFVVTLSDSLTALFGTQETISVYDVATGITYILPASLRSLFERGRTDAGTNEQAAEVAEAEEAVPEPEPAPAPAPTGNATGQAA